MAQRRSARTAASSTTASPSIAPTTVSLPLDGCTITLSGKFDAYGGQSHSSLESLIRTLGGTVTKSVTRATTHCVCSGIDYHADSPKVASAKLKGLPLVSPYWIVEADKQKAVVDVEKFIWPMQGNGNFGGSDSEADTNGATGKKRPIAIVKKDEGDEDDGDEKQDQPQLKKTKAAKGRKAKGNPGKKTEEEAEPEITKEDAEPEVTKEEEVVAEGQFIKKKSAVIPIDEYCNLGPTYQVYVDEDNMIWDASLNQSNAMNNNNKFYRVQVVCNSSEYKTWTRWGRVGETGQFALLGDGTLSSAVKNFEKKFKDKSGLSWDNRGDEPKPNKYAFVERSYDPDSSDDEDEDEDEDGSDDKKLVKKEEGAETDAGPECTLEKPVKELMELIFNKKYFQATMTSFNYDANKLPLGKLSKGTITRGFSQLKELANILNDPEVAIFDWGMSADAAIEHLSNTFYSVIPHAFGRNRPPVIRDHDLLKKEVELLESLSDMKCAIDMMKVSKTNEPIHPLDKQFLGLGMEEMTPLDQKSNEFTMLESYLQGSKGKTHHLTCTVDEIFRIKRKGEAARFDSSPYAKIASDRRLLWHGSRCTNFGGILSQGLRIAPPEAPVSGYMFGKGIYLADVSSKSAGYCVPHISNGHILLLLCEAELGDPIQKLTGADYNAGENAKSNGMYSTWGQGTHGPSNWVDAGVVDKSLEGIKMPDPSMGPTATNIEGAGLWYNEFICYDIAQVKLRYLFRIRVK